MTLPLLPTYDELLAQHEALRGSLIDRLSVPDVSSFTQVRDGLQTLKSIDTDTVSMDGEARGENNDRAVKELKRDLESSTQEIEEGVDGLIDNLLVRPFADALSLVREHQIAWGEWTPSDWLMAFHEVAQVPKLIDRVVQSASVADFQTWYDLVQEVYPKLHTWCHWSEALSKCTRPIGVREALIERLMNDESLVMPERRDARHQRLPALAPEEIPAFKAASLQTIAWDSFFHRHHEANIRQAIWSAYPPSVESVNWEKVVRAMREKTHQTFYQDPSNQRVAFEKVPQVVAMLTELMGTGCLNDWLSRPEQWVPVEPSELPDPAVNRRGATHPNGHVEPWYSPAIREGRFTWSMLVQVFDIDEQPHIVQRLREMVEPWALRQTLDHTLANADVAPVVRERARL